MFSCANSLGRNYYLCLLISASFILFFAGLGSRELWLTDEPRVAGIAAGMVVDGEFIAPLLNGVPFIKEYSVKKDRYVIGQFYGQ